MGRGSAVAVAVVWVVMALMAPCVDVTGPGPCASGNVAWRVNNQWMNSMAGEGAAFEPLGAGPQKLGHQA